MSRIKHLSMLVLKIVYILLCFIISATVIALQSYRTDEIEIGRGLDVNDIFIFKGRLNETGSSVTCEAVDGKIVFDIQQSGERFDDIKMYIPFPEVNYSTDYIELMLGEDADKEHEYINAMKEGPWDCDISFSLKNEEVASSDNGSFTFISHDLTEYKESVNVKGANKSHRTQPLTISKNERPEIGIIFGTERDGALPSGRYTLQADINVKGLNNSEIQAPSLSLFKKIGIFTKIATKAVAEKGLGIFSSESWLTLYGITLLLGWFIYLYRDIRVVISVFIAVLSDNWSGVGEIVYGVYKNGVRIGTYVDDTGSFAKIILALIISGLAWALLTVTIPLRILWYLIRDIIYLIKEDDESLDEFSFFGNLLGSIGTYLILFGLAGLMGAGFIAGVICCAIGLVLVIIASHLCRNCEDYV